MKEILKEVKLGQIIGIYHFEDSCFTVGKILKISSEYLFLLSYDINFKEDGIKVFLTHGHLYDVKRTLNSIKEIGKKLSVSLVIFGHTHKPYMEKDGDMILFNPGATEDGRYGIIILENGNIQLFHKQL